MHMWQLTIGVFDSGVDTKHMPYGTKSPEQLLKLVVPILKSMADDGCQVIVVACNTVTTTIITQLRHVIPVPLVAVEPLIKQAADITESQVIAVCATPATLASPRYKWLKDTYAEGLTVLEPDCVDWAVMIESNRVDHEHVRTRIEDVCRSGADVIVLGCTHYHWIENEITDAAATYKAVVIQPEDALVRQLKHVLHELYPELTPALG
jgi:glutamate racemase